MIDTAEHPDPLIYLTQDQLAELEAMYKADQAGIRQLRPIDVMVIRLSAETLRECANVTKQALLDTGSR